MDMAKKMAGEYAAELIEDGMNIGLGTGSTVYWTILRLAERVKQGIRVRCIPTSEKTAKLAQQLNIPLISFADLVTLDLAIDGADEFDPGKNLIKGGGGALLREKLVATSARRFVVVADVSKQVAALGRFPLPVEVVPFAYQTTLNRIANYCESIAIRTREDGVTPLLTDNGNYIVDCAFGRIEQPHELHAQLKMLQGVVETGLFTKGVEAIVVSDGKSVQMIS